MCRNLSALFVFPRPQPWPLFCWANWNPFTSPVSCSPFFLTTPPTPNMQPFFLLSWLLSFFSASGQNNSSQLTPISSLALPLQPLFPLFFHLSIMAAPQDVILTECFNACKTFASNTFCQQSAPFPSNPTACLWLVCTLLAVPWNKNTYALTALICCPFPPPKKDFIVL